MKWSKWFQFSKLDNNRLIHSLKTAIAFLIGVVVVRLFHFSPNGQWVLISILVLMCAQSRVGAVMQKSYMRFLGTVLGASIAAFALLVAYPSVVWTTLILCCAAALFGYLADSPKPISEAATLGAVTTIIIVTGQNPSYLTVVSRFFEISLGILIALLVSRFIWPVHSRTQLRNVVMYTLQDLNKAFKQLELFPSEEAKKNYETYEDNILKRFTSQTGLLNEVRGESLGFRRSDFIDVFRSILRSERESLRWINLMKNALIGFSEEVRLNINQQMPVKKIYERGQQLFQTLIKQIDDKDTESSVVTLNGLANWKNEMHKALDPLINNDSDKLAVDLFIFSAENLLKQLEETSHLIKKI